MTRLSATRAKHMEQHSVRGMSRRGLDKEIPAVDSEGHDKVVRPDADSMDDNEKDDKKR